MRVLIVTGAYPPVKCGVGDYAFHLSEALAAQPGVVVGVLTGLSSEPSLSLSRVRLFRVMPNWRIRSVLRAMHVIFEFQPDVVHIQYPAQGYNGRLPKLLPLFVRLLGLPVIQTWHEHYVECAAIGWQNLLACNALIYVRPDFLSKLPRWVIKWLGKTPLAYIPNASTIPVVSLTAQQSHEVKRVFSSIKPVVCYFGFAYPNKGLERLFEIVDPEKYHLVLMCDLDESHPYQAEILKLTHQKSWNGNVTVTGFLPAQRVGEILAIADAAVFPFPDGAGEWNTSLKAVEAAGIFTIATTHDASLLGYHQTQNIYFADCDRIVDMSDALNRYVGTRKSVEVGNPWVTIAMKHEQLYRKLCNEK